MPRSQSLGIHFFFVRDGLNSASVSAKPSSWLNLGVVDDLDIDPKDKLSEIIGPAPGRRDRLDVVLTERVIDFSANLKQVASQIWQLAWGSLPFDATTTPTDYQFNPNEGGLVKGWAKFQGYDHDNVLRVNVEMWCALQLASPLKLGADVVSPQVRGLVIRNTLNTGSMLQLIQ